MGAAVSLIRPLSLMHNIPSSAKQIREKALEMMLVPSEPICASGGGINCGKGDDVIIFCYKRDGVAQKMCFLTRQSSHTLHRFCLMGKKL